MFHPRGRQPVGLAWEIHRESQLVPLNSLLGVGEVRTKASRPSNKGAETNKKKITQDIEIRSGAQKHVSFGGLGDQKDPPTPTTQPAAIWKRCSEKVPDDCLL